VLEPVRGVGEGIEFGGVAVAQAVVSHFGEEKGVAFAPEDARGDVDRRIRKFAAMAEGGAIPVQHGGGSAGLRPCGEVEGDIVRRESAGAAEVEKRVLAEAEIEGREDEFGKPRELEEEHVPTAAKLATI
jgi:hypothetical protein